MGHASLLPCPCYGAASHSTLPQLTSNPARQFCRTERLCFEPNLQSTVEKTWGGYRQRVQELKQLRHYKQGIPEAGGRKAG